MSFDERTVRRDSGGKFAPTPHGEPALEASPRERPVGDVIAGQRQHPGRYGQAGVRVGSATPWGKAQDVTHVAPGIAEVGAAGHGGFKLSAQRNSAIPEPLRRAGGWYEEDAEADIVGMIHPEAFPRWASAPSRCPSCGQFVSGDGEPHVCDPSTGGPMDAVRADCRARVKEWFPDEYEEATGEPVPPEESLVRRRQIAAAARHAFALAHANEFVGTPGVEAWAPDGYRVVVARCEAAAQERAFLVPAEQTPTDDALGHAPMVIDPLRHPDVTAILTLGGPAPPPEPALIAGDALGIDFGAVTARARGSARRELGRRFRFPEGVATLEEHLSLTGCYGKTMVVHPGAGRAEHYVEVGENRVIPVGKATWDVLTGVPDVTAPEARLSSRLNLARSRVDSAAKAAQRSPTRENTERWRRAKADAARALDEHRVWYEHEKAAGDPLALRTQARKDAARAALERHAGARALRVPSHERA